MMSGTPAGSAVASAWWRSTSAQRCAHSSDRPRWSRLSPQVSDTYAACAWIRADGIPTASATAVASAITSAASGNSFVYARVSAAIDSASARSSLGGSPATSASASTVSSIAESWSSK